MGPAALAELDRRCRAALTALGWEPAVPDPEVIVSVCADLGVLRVVVATFINELGPGAAGMIDAAAEAACASLEQTLPGGLTGKDPR